MKTFRLILLCLLLLPGGCTKSGLSPEPAAPTGEPSTEVPDQKTLDTYRYAGYFGRNLINLYYLWQKEIRNDLENWDDTKNPIDIVKDIRYHTGSGENRVDIDRWTIMTDDYKKTYGGFSGSSKTSGLSVTYYAVDQNSNQFYPVVNYVAKDSPADKAGLRRGDVIIAVNGKDITMANINDINRTLETGDSFTITLYDGKTIPLASKEMYLDPIHRVKTFDCPDKKVGYLHFTSFTLEACEPLVDVFSRFKAEGVSELVLDLRYNSGGFVTTENVLASMLAPEAEVLAGNVLSTEIYNDALTASYRQNNHDTNTYFQTDFSFSNDSMDHRFSTAGANPDLNRIYVITTSRTASASESLIGELKPYMSVTTIGRKTSGKYCSGYLLSSELFVEQYSTQLDQIHPLLKDNIITCAPNWGLYVMFARYADKNGETLSMPDGIAPDYGLTDNPLEGHDLGDPEEPLLAKALSLCGYQAVKARSLKHRSSWTPGPGLPTFRPAGDQPLDGCRIYLPQDISLPR